MVSMLSTQVTQRTQTTPRTSLLPNASPALRSSSQIIQATPIVPRKQSLRNTQTVPHVQATISAPESTLRSSYAVNIPELILPKENMKPLTPPKKVVSSQQSGLAGLKELINDIDSGKYAVINGKPIHLDKKITVNAMAPLEVKDNQWGEFKNTLKSLKKQGVNAISVDVWWGKVWEKGKDKAKANWSYYDKMFKTVKEEGLHIVPILAFHKCGGNVGDDVNIPVPDCVWSDVAKKRGMQFDENNKGALEQVKNKLNYKNEHGDLIDDYVPIWHDDQAVGNYKEFMQQFKDRYQDYSKDIDEVNVSLGPAGELRYPTYGQGPEAGQKGPKAFPGNPRGAEYPKEGWMVGYDEFGEKAFRDHIVNKYENLDGVNKAWGTKLKDASQIRLPNDAAEQGGKASGFLNSGYYKGHKYSEDLFEFQHNKLMEHGDKVLKEAKDVFSDGDWGKADIGYKVPGIHWGIGAEKLGSQENKRLPEILTGLVKPVDINNPKKAYGYEDIINIGRKRDAVMHFTCLEKPNKAMDGPYKANSRAKDLVNLMVGEAHKRGVRIKGENALNGGLYANGGELQDGWKHMKDAMNNGYDGMTFLRSTDLARKEPKSFFAEFKQNTVDVLNKHREDLANKLKAIGTVVKGAFDKGATAKNVDTVKKVLKKVA